MLRRGPAGLTRLGRCSQRQAFGHLFDLFQASALLLSSMLQRRHGRLCSPQVPLPPSCAAEGGASGGRGQPALSRGELAFVAGASGLCALRHDPKLGRGSGEKKAKAASKVNTWIGPWMRPPVTWPPMRYMMDRSACLGGYTHRGLSPCAAIRSFRRRLQPQRHQLASPHRHLDGRLIGHLHDG